MSSRQSPAPGVILPALVAYGLLLAGDDLLAWLGVPQEPLPWHVILSVAMAAVMAVFAMRIHRRWRREQGLDPDRVPRRWRPEWAIGAAVWFLGLPLAALLGARGLVAGAIAAAVAVLILVTLVVVAAVKEPRRKQADLARHEASRADVFQ